MTVLFGDENNSQSYLVRATSPHGEASHSRSSPNFPQTRNPLKSTVIVQPGPARVTLSDVRVQVRHRRSLRRPPTRSSRGCAAAAALECSLRSRCGSRTAAARPARTISSPSHNVTVKPGSRRLRCRCWGRVIMIMINPSHDDRFPGVSLAGPAGGHGSRQPAARLGGLWLGIDSDSPA